MSGAAQSYDSVAWVVTPNVADAQRALEFLREHAIAARPSSSLSDFSRCFTEPPGCVVVAEEALVAEEMPAMREALARLPAWSDLPIILVAADVAALESAAAEAFPNSGNVTLLERPVNPRTLVSAVQVALRAAERQRDVGALLEQRELDVRQRDEFLAMLAHELRNPLAPMRNTLYLLRMFAGKDVRTEKGFDILDRQLGHLVRLVDDLMDVARLERGKVVLRRQRLNLNDAVSAAIESCIDYVRQRGHTIDLRCAQDQIPVDADAVRLEQIVGNLVNNAAKFSPHPGVIEVATECEAGFARVAVTDRGLGFERAEAERLFVPFLQAHATIERTAGGLGMGLTIVRRLVELHGGSVHAWSDGPGKGSRFEVRIPLASQELEPPRRQPAEGKAGRCRRIVLVEDNADALETTQSLLRLWGHEVVTAKDGSSGLQLILQFRPDVALVDIGLPGMNGYEVARAVRAAMPPGTTRLIALTGYGQPADKESALRAGFDTHVLKPISPDALGRLLQTSFAA